VATAYFTHPLFRHHEMGPHHPECPARLQAIERQLLASGLHRQLQHHVAPQASDEAILRVHEAAYLQQLKEAAPTEGYRQLDPDTSMNPYTLQAVYHGAGAAVAATDLVLGGVADNAFCAVRPPGHHAEPGRAMGFCLFNNIAVAAAHALEVHALQRVAIVDFDVHHGNGTEAMFAGDERILFCSSFQHPFYPGTRLNDAPANIRHAPLRAGDGGREFRAIYHEQLLPALEAFSPQLLLISAGFDGHSEDRMSGLELGDDDYRWLSERLVRLAARHAGGRIVSLLEGGYALNALGRCTSEHIGILLEAAA